MLPVLQNYLHVINMLKFIRFFYLLINTCVLPCLDLHLHFSALFFRLNFVPVEIEFNKTFMRCFTTLKHVLCKK